MLRSHSLASTIVAMIVGCGGDDAGSSYVPEVGKGQVEISPGNFLPYEQWDWHVDDPRNKSGREKSRLRIRYGKHVVEWWGMRRHSRGAA